MVNHPPKVVLLAGPNGVGKSTSAEKLLLGTLKVQEFVNADTIAQGLSAFAPNRVALEAGRIMLARLKELARKRPTSPLKRRWQLAPTHRGSGNFKVAGYEIHLLFLWLPNADTAVARVADRVRLGGHGVPEATIRRR